MEPEGTTSAPDPTSAPRRWRWIALAIALGVLLGLACFTFRYAEGLSYFSTDPRARADDVEQRNYDLLQRGGHALVGLLDAVAAARAKGATPAQLAPALALQRHAQWRLDFIAAENSMGFHAPQEAARVVGEAIDDARQGQIAALTALEPAPAASPAPPSAVPRSGSAAPAR